MRRRVILISIFLALVPPSVMAQRYNPYDPFNRNPKKFNPWENRTVIDVVDGDTIILDNGEVIRLIGLLSPRSAHGDNEGEQFGEEARNITENFLLGKQVEISFDPAYVSKGHRDQYGCALAYITVKSGAESLFVNLELLKLGAGYYSPGPAQLMFNDLMKRAEDEARKRKFGFWAKTDRSPKESTEAAGKAFEEPPPSINPSRFRITRPISSGP